MRTRFVQTAPAVRPLAGLQSASKKTKQNCELDDRRAEHTELRRPAADRGALWEVFREKKIEGGKGAAKGHLFCGGAKKNQTAFPFRGVGLCVCKAEPRKHEFGNGQLFQLRQMLEFKPSAAALLWNKIS